MIETAKGLAVTFALVLTTVVGGTLMLPSPVGAVCQPGEECFPDPVEDPGWYDQNCWEDGEDYCCRCEETGVTACVRVE